MCGIAGVRRMDAKSAPIGLHEITTLLTSLEYRGNDATGVALQRYDGEVRVFKDHIGAWRFTTSEDYKKWMKENLDDQVETALLHTRRATKGTPHLNKNNHPLFAGHGAVVHNGHVNNDDQLFKDLKLERRAETDTDILRAIIDDCGITKKAFGPLNKVMGAVAAAAVHPDHPGKLLLLRCGNPLVLASAHDKLYWASDKRAIYCAAKPWVQRWGMFMQLNSADLAFINAYEDTGWILERDKGLAFHSEFKTYGKGANNYSAVYCGDYSVRQERFAREAAPKPAARVVEPTDNGGWSIVADSPKFVYCPNENCKMPDGKRMLIAISDQHRGWPLHRLCCDACHTNLACAETRKEVIN